MPVVLLIEEDKDTRKQKQIIVPIGNQYTQNVNGADVMFEDLNTSPAVIVSVKENPQYPTHVVCHRMFRRGNAFGGFRDRI